MNRALLVDVGGTNMRYALANFLDDDLSDINKIPFDHEKFENFIEEIIDTNEVDTLIISIAGPKINNTILLIDYMLHHNRKYHQQLCNNLMVFLSNLKGCHLQKF